MPHEQLALTIVHVGSIVVNITMLSEQLAHTLILSATEEADIANVRGIAE